MKADMLTQVVLPLSLFIIMLGMGLSLKRADFTRVFSQPKAVLIGISCQMLLLPMVACILIALFGLTAELAVGLLIIAFCPGGATSNMMSYLAKGDLALSISLTALVSLITPFSIPLLTALAMSFLLDTSQQFSIPIVKTILQLIVITIVPVVMGMIIHHKYPLFSAKTQQPIKVFSIVFLFLIIAGIVAKNWHDMAQFFIQTGLASFALCSLSLTLGYVISNLSNLNKAQAVSISIEVGIQNGTLALVVAGTLLGSSVMTIPAVTYSLLMFIIGGMFSWWVNR